MTEPAVAFDDVLAAAARIGGSVVHTPTSRSQTLSAITGVEVWVKFENLQFTASFKERGARNRLELLRAAGNAAGVVAASAGNHAQGLAHHAALMGLAATIVMPASTPVGKVTRTRLLGAEVVLHGASFEEAAARAQEIAAERGLVVVHGFDDAAVIAGQGTVALEMLAAVPELDTLVIPIGGGGLAAGMAVAARGSGRGGGPRLVGVEVEGYAWASGKLGQRRGGASLAEGIAVKQPGRLTAPIIAELIDEVVVVSEDTIEQAIGLYLEIEKTVSEGAGAAALAAVLQHGDRFAGQRCGLVLSGGNIDLRLLAEVAMRSLAVTGRLAVLRIAIDDLPGVLARIVATVAAAGGNIVDVQHLRHRPTMSSRRAEIVLEVEFGVPADLEGAVERLTAEGFEVTVG